jgi:hypothetical protein
MKTLEYNPSYLEIVVAESIADLHNDIEKRLSPGSLVIDVERQLKLDNPRIKFIIQDMDGDIHKIVIQIIQTIDA